MLDRLVNSNSLSNAGCWRRAVGALGFSLLLSVALSACGGGGDSSATAPAADATPPVASAKVSGESVLNTLIVFDTAGTQDPQGRALTRTWAYGDGATGTADSHVYTSAGSFTAVFTVRNSAGTVASVSVPVTVAKCSAAGSKAATLSPYPTVCMQSSKGEFVVEVYPVQAPQTAANFLKYVSDGFYAGTLFHRVIPGFVVQGGGYGSGLVVKTAIYPGIPLESNNGLLNWQYTLAMARTSVPDSATSQFFVNLVDNHALDYSSALATPNGYAVFGQVISGTAVIDAIGAVATGTTGGLSDVPLQEVTIVSAVRLP